MVGKHTQYQSAMMFDDSLIAVKYVLRIAKVVSLDCLWSSSGGSDVRTAKEMILNCNGHRGHTAF